MSNFNDVKTFMHAFGQEVKVKAKFPNEKIIKLRYELIREELGELKRAIEAKNLKKCSCLNNDLYVTKKCVYLDN